MQTRQSCQSACEHGLFCQQVPLSTSNYREGLGRCCSSQVSCSEGCTTVAGPNGCATGCRCPTPSPTPPPAATTPEAAITLPAGATAPTAGDASPGDVGVDTTSTAPSDLSASGSGKDSAIDGIMIAVFAVLAVASVALVLALLRNRKRQSRGGYTLPTAQVGAGGKRNGAAPEGPGPPSTVASAAISETRFGSGTSAPAAAAPAGPAAGNPSNKVILTEDGFEPAFEQHAQQRPAPPAAPQQQSPKSFVVSEDGFGEGRGRQMPIGTSTRRQASAGSTANAKTYDSEWAGGGIEGYVDVSGDRHATWVPEYYDNPDETEA